jgi:hypothetical protein
VWHEEGLVDTAPRLKVWLESNPCVYPETVTVEYIDGMNDHGVDVLLTGRSSKLLIGFQIKSDGDLRKSEFTLRLKAQMTDAQRYGLALLVVVFACRPTRENQRKCRYFQAQFADFPGDRIWIVDPHRAAGLLLAFDSAIRPLRHEPKGWRDLFLAAKQDYIAPLYLDKYWGLEPDQRFQAPKEFDDIMKAVNLNPLTIISGPPAVGKTFTALQVLWKKFCDGYDVSWIGPARLTPPAGIIPEEHAVPDMKRRIDLMARELGRKGLQPRDAHDFISEHLNSNSIIYLEDPFGQSDDEFRYSLHTYRFFDLHEFVSAISKGARSGCHILITSRAGLFDRWLDDCKRTSAALPEFGLIRMAPTSYSRQQHLSLVGEFVHARGLPQPDKVIPLIARHVKVPLDAERIIRELDEVTYEGIVAQIKRFEGDYHKRLAARVLVDSDADRLFLLLLATLRSQESGGHDFCACFKTMHAALSIDGDADESLNKAMDRYRPLFSRLEHHVLTPLRGGRVGFAEEGFHLEAIHSTICDEITRNLRAKATDWLCSVALALPSVKPDPYSLRVISMHLLEWQVGKTQERAQNAIVQVLLDDRGIGMSEISRFMDSWQLLSADAKKAALDYIARQEDSIIEQTCSALNYAEIPPDEAWDFLRLLIVKPRIGTRKFNVFGDPWKYLSTHLNEIPPDIRQALDERARTRPVYFTYALSEVLVACWGAIPQLWEEAFLNPKCLSDPDLQYKTLLEIARNWKVVPTDLRDLFDEQSRHEDYRVRAAAGAASLAAYESAPDSLVSFFMNAVDDPDVRVPIDVMKEGLGEDEHDRIFAEALFQKVEGPGAANMLQLLINRRNFKDATWTLELARKCIEKGDELAQAVLFYAHRSYNREQTDMLGYRPPESLADQPASVRFAWLWLYANQDQRQRTLKSSEAIDLLVGLSDDFRESALFILSVQANYMPIEVQEHLQGLEQNSGPAAAAIQLGKERRQPSGGKRTTYSFPILHFLS